MKTPLKIAIAGLGTVGAGTLQLLQRQAELLAMRAGRPLVVTAVSARDRRRDRGADLSAARWYDDAAALAADPEVDVVVELIGGAEGVGRRVVETALTSKGRPARIARCSPWRWSSCNVPAPTVPSPAMAILSGVFKHILRR